MSMSMSMPFQFFDPSQIPQNIMWMGIAWGIQYAWKKIRQNNQLKISRHIIWRKTQWFKIGLHALSLIACMYIGNFWKFVGLVTVEKQFTKIVFFNLKCGYYIFKKLEPDVAEALLAQVKEWFASKGST